MIASASLGNDSIAFISSLYLISVKYIKLHVTQKKCELIPLGIKNHSVAKSNVY